VGRERQRRVGGKGERGKEKGDEGEGDGVGGKGREEKVRGERGGWREGKGTEGWGEGMRGKVGTEEGTHMAIATPDLRLPSQPQSITPFTAPWPVPNYYTAW